MTARSSAAWARPAHAFQWPGQVRASLTLTLDEGDHTVPAPTRPVIRWNPAEQAWETTCRGYSVLSDPWLNKGTAFTESERDALG